MMPLEISEPIAQSIVDTFDAPVDEILTANLDNELLYGALLSGGNFYSYSSDGFNLAIAHHDSITQELNDYAQGMLDATGIRVDSDTPYDWIRGMMRMDAQVKCKSGGTPCGARCLPKGQTCRKGMNAKSQSAIGGAKTKLRSGNGAKVAAGIAAGLVGAAAAGGAAYVGYKGRDELARGGKVIAERMKQAGREAGRDLKAGKEVAKSALKQVKPAMEQIDKGTKFAQEVINRSPDLSPKQKRVGTRGTQYTAAIGKGGAALAGGGAAAAAGAVAAEEAARSIGRGVKSSAKTAVRTAKAVGRKVAEDFKKKEPDEKKKKKSAGSLKGS